MRKFLHNGKEYRSKKHPVLEYTFQKKNPDRNSEQEVISFTIKDIKEAMFACRIELSYESIVLDLMRRSKAGIESRLPESIFLLGYDLRKRTGKSPDGNNYAGEFVFVGVGNQLKSWLEWRDEFEEIDISSLPIPDKIRRFLRNDEGALFSVIDYCDVFSQALFGKPNVVWRVQNPMKWQPNEIDGFYFAEVEGQDFLLPIEAKALTTGDDINLVQMQGALETVSKRYQDYDVLIIPLAVQMIKNGMQIAVFKQFSPTEEYDVLDFEKLDRQIKVNFLPMIDSWRKR